MLVSEARDVIPCWARILHHTIMLKVQLQKIYVLLRAMHAFEIRIHMISRIVLFVLRCISKEWMPLWKWSIMISDIAKTALFASICYISWFVFISWSYQLSIKMHQMFTNQWKILSKHIQSLTVWGYDRGLSLS